MNLLQRIITPPAQQRDLVELVETMQPEKVERIGENFRSYVTRGYQDNGIIWACVIARVILFSQIEFALQDKQTREIRPLPPRLRFLDRPWPGGTSAELLARIEQDTSLAGNYYINRDGDRLQRLRPDWVDIVTDGREPMAYAYYVGGDRGKRPRVLLADEVAHGNPYPDPVKAFVGNSWVSSVVRDVLADKAMTAHKLKFFENAATPNLLVKFKQTLTSDQRELIGAALKERHEGLRNAWKTLVLEGGADAQVVGANIEQAAFEAVQAAGENRVTVAARVPSIVLGIKEGAAQATYNNYGQAVRAFADHTMRHLWAHAVGVLEQVVDVPAGTRLWYDDRHIPALQADAKDEADILQVNASTIRSLTDGGFTPESVVQAVETGDFTLLEHTGVFSAQLRPPETGTNTSETDDVDDRFARVIANLKE